MVIEFDAHVNLKFDKMNFFQSNVINCELLKGAWKHGMGLKMTRMHKNMQHVPMLVDKKNSVWTHNETIYKKWHDWIIYKTNKLKYVHI